MVAVVAARLRRRRAAVSLILLELFLGALRIRRRAYGVIIAGWLRVDRADRVHGRVAQLVALDGDTAAGYLKELRLKGIEVAGEVCLVPLGRVILVVDSTDIMIALLCMLATVLLAVRNCAA